MRRIVDLELMFTLIEDFSSNFGELVIKSVLKYSLATGANKAGKLLDSTDTELLC
jgi:hypothetical protein